MKQQKIFFVTSLVNRALIITFLLFPFASQSQVWQWGRMGRCLNGNGSGYTVVTDAESNVYVGGNYFGGSIAWGTDTIYNSVPPSLSDAAFIAKYNSAGALLWMKSYGIGDLTGEMMSIAVDASGFIYIAGYFGGSSYILGSDTLLKSEVSGSAMFVAKLNDVGDVIWATTPVAADTGGTYVSSIAVDDAGNVYVTGDFANWAVFGSDTLRDDTHSFIDYPFIVKYDGSGNALWAKQSATGNNDGSPRIAVDRHGNAYIAGIYGSPGIVFGSDALATYPGYSSFLVKYNTDGYQIWAKRNYAAVGALGISKAGDAVVIGGFFSDTLITGSDTIIHGSDTTFNGFTAKFDPSGSELWAKIITGSYPYTNAVCVDDADNVYVTGDFGSAPGDTINVSGISVECTADGGGIYVAKYTSAGDVIWATPASGGGAIPLSISCDSPGANIFITGDFSTTPIVFGYDTLDCSGDPRDQVFVAKINATALSVPEASVLPVSVYPNPAQDELTISCVNKITSVTITDLMGKTVSDHCFSSSLVQVAVSELTPGIYFVKINGTQVRKFIKQ